MNRTHNDVIQAAGLYYIGHFGGCSIRICGTNWCISIPVERIEELVAIFPEMRWEDGEYIESIKGRYVRVTDDGFRVTALQHIVKDIAFVI